MAQRVLASAIWY